MKLLCIVLTILLCLGLQLTPQAENSSAPSKLGNFSTDDFGRGGADLQFYPGGIVYMEEGEAKHQYVFRNDRFVAVPYALAAEFRGWKSFDWEGVDILNQIDVQSFDPDIRQLLPTGSRVKKVLDVPMNRLSHHLVVVCYSFPTTDKHPMTNDTDLFLVGLERVVGAPADKFTLRWSMKVASASDYGNFTIERVSGGGLFGVLYHASVGGSSVSRELDIYRIIP
jgi:hypothetical protein